MTVKADERRTRQRDALILAAERRIADHGSAGLKARDLAQDIGIALGAIYNLVPDLDELRFHVTLRTLKRLDAELERAADAAADARPVTVLIAIAHAYFGFAEANRHLWRSVFEHQVGPERKVPDWLMEEQTRMFQRVLAPLTELMPESTPNERQLFAHTLFTATHGIVDMGLQQRMFAIPEAAIRGQLAFVLTVICDGLAGR